MIGIYCRTSKSREEKYTLETQKAGGIKCANELGLDYCIYIDDGISGTKDENSRAGLAMLFSDIKKGKISAVFCMDQQRIQRDEDIWTVFSLLCINHEINYYQGGKLIDLEDPALKMSAKITSIFDKFYTEQTSLKVKDANARKAALGKTHGLKAYGYKKGNNNMYEIDEAEAIHVRTMFKMSLEGIGAYRIANYLNDQNIPTKFSGNFKSKGVITRKNKFTGEIDQFEKSAVKWRGNVISDILKNPIYKGDRIWRLHKDKFDILDGKKIKTKIVVETITGKVPAIVTENLWNSVQSNFIINKKESVGKKAQYHYLLNGLVFCERCGNKYWGKKRLKGNDNAYKCLSKKYPNPKCDNRGLSLPRLETFVLQYLQRKPLSSSVLKALPKQYSLIDKHQEKLDVKSKELEQLNKKIKITTSLLEKSTKIKEIFDLVESMNNKRNYLVADVAALEKKIAEEKLLNPSTVVIKEGRKKISMLSKINSDFTEIQKTVNQLVDWISIQYVNDAKPAYFKIKIKLKGLEYVDEYIVDFHLNVWEQVGYYISKLNSKGSPLINISRTSEFNLKMVSENIRLLSKYEGGRIHNNKFILKPSDIYNFD